MWMFNGETKGNYDKKSSLNISPFFRAVSFTHRTRISKCSMHHLTEAFWVRLLCLDVYSQWMGSRKTEEGAERKQEWIQEVWVDTEEGRGTGRELNSRKTVCLELSCTPSRGKPQESRICWAGMQRRGGETQELHWVSNLFIPMSEKWLGEQPLLIIELSGSVPIPGSEAHSFLPHLLRIYITWYQRSWGARL